MDLYILHSSQAVKRNYLLSKLLTFLYIKSDSFGLVLCLARKANGSSSPAQT